MAIPVIDEHGVRQPNEFNIYGCMGYFTVDFTSSGDSIHRIAGFKTEDAARIWIADTTLPIGCKSH